MNLERKERQIPLQGVHRSTIRMTSSAPVGTIVLPRTFVGITDAVRPVRISGRTCITSYTKDFKIRPLRDPWTLVNAGLSLKTSISHTKTSLRTIRDIPVGTGRSRF